MNRNNKLKAAELVRQVIGAMPQGKQFHGWELRDACVQIEPALQNMYVDTFLRAMREFCHNDYKLVNRSESIYEKTTTAIIYETVNKPNDVYAKYRTLKQQDFDF